MAPSLEEDHPSIVILGGFDPRLLEPHWFRTHKLLGEQEAQQADLRFVLPQLTEWSTDLLFIQIAQERFLAQAKVESAADALRDLVLGMLQILDQTRATAIGLNRTMHFNVGGEDNWHKVGHRLAPKDLWRPHLKKQPGLQTLQIIELTRADGLPGKVAVTVQPSVKYTHGVYFDVNNEVVNADAKPGASFVSETIREHWPRLLAEARLMAETVLEEATR